MADVELVIKIDEKAYNALTHAEFDANLVVDKMRKAIVNGTQLPKGYGTLKDFEKLYADMNEREELARQRVIDTPSNSPCYMRYVAQLNERTAFKEMLYEAPTIIKAESEV